MQEAQKDGNSFLFDEPLTIHFFRRTSLMTQKKEEDTQQWAEEISDDDIIEAMKDMEGFVDITIGDFRELYHFAVNHAMERMYSGKTVKDIMTSEVIHVNGDTKLSTIVETMATNSISGVPVIDDKMTVVGVISEKDILHHMGDEGPKSFMGVLTECVGSKRCFATSLSNSTAKDIMSTPPVTAMIETSVFDINRTLTDLHINRIPIVNQDKKLIGIVSRADALKAQINNQKR